MEENEEELAEEVRYKETLAWLESLKQRYERLFGKIPSGSIKEIQDEIATEMKRKGIRPYKL